MFANNNRNLDVKKILSAACDTAGDVQGLKVLSVKVTPSINAVESEQVREVPGGCIYTKTFATTGGVFAQSTCFVPGVTIAESADKTVTIVAEKAKKTKE